ncbi:MAG TPA: tetratricopeptide repeat protein [Spirochaetia bacterium]|nr:tetratricopeptide repeat protein [Spirochaetia bacterium]
MTTISLPLPSKEQLREQYAEETDVYEKVLYEVHRRMKQNFIRTGVPATIKYRVKSFESMYEKLLRKLKLTGQREGSIQMTDLLGLRVVCAFMEDLNKAEEQIRQTMNVVEVERKGANFSVKEFGYESTHYLTRIPDDIADSFHVGQDLLCEIQLRTILQDAWAEVEHELVYKAEFTPFDEPLRRKLAALNANLSLSDIIFQEIRDYQRQLHSELKKRRELFWKKMAEVTGDQIDSNGGSGNGADLQEPVATVVDPDEASFEEVEGGNFVRSLVMGSETIDNMLLKALAAHNQNRLGTAIRIYSEILSFRPKEYIQAIIHVHRGMAYFTQAQYAPAIDDFSRAMELDARNPKAYYYRGVVQRVLGHYSQSLEDLNACLELDPYQFDPLYARAQVYFQLGDYGGSLQDLERALSIQPDAAHCRTYRDMVFQKIDHK